MFAGSGLACWRGERLVFRGLSFALGPGGALLLGGPNGSGKSSLLRMMAGLLPPLTGTLLWDGVPVAEDRTAHNARLHFIGHQDAVKPVLTTRETIDFWGGLHGGNTGMHALERFGLAALADTPCRYLSAGQKKRLSLARLLASPAPLWLLDEPTTGLDAASVEALEAAMREHRAAGGIVVAATHIALDLAGAASLSLADYAPTAAEAAG
jgi:heme exporter protein A